MPNFPIGILYGGNYAKTIPQRIGNISKKFGFYKGKLCPNFRIFDLGHLKVPWTNSNSTPPMSAIPLMRGVRIGCAHICIPVRQEIGIQIDSIPFLELES